MPWRGKTACQPSSSDRRSQGLALIAVQHQSEDAMRATAEGFQKFMGYLADRAGKAMIVFEGEPDQELMAGDIITDPNCMRKSWGKNQNIN